VSLSPHDRPHPGFATGAEVWLFRHGEVDPAWHGRAYGGMDIALSERGERETEERARAFSAIPFRAVVSSPLRRALRLGEALAHATNAKLVVTPELSEIERGEWSGMPVAELHAARPSEVEEFFADPWSFRVPGGENDSDVLGRVLPAFERALRVHGGPLALTSHYNVMRVLLAHLLGVSPANSFRLRVDVSSACMVRDTAKGWVLCRWNTRAPSSFFSDASSSEGSTGETR
jgi:probable phosphoglycerate mutase